MPPPPVPSPPPTVDLSKLHWDICTQKRFCSRLDDIPVDRVADSDVEMSDVSAYGPAFYSPALVGTSGRSLSTEPPTPNKIVLHFVNPHDDADDACTIEDEPRTTIVVSVLPLLLIAVQDCSRTDPVAEAWEDALEKFDVFAAQPDSNRSQLVARFLRAITQEIVCVEVGLPWDTLTDKDFQQRVLRRFEATPHFDLEWSAWSCAHLSIADPAQVAACYEAYLMGVEQQLFPPMVEARSLPEEPVTIEEAKQEEEAEEAMQKASEVDVKDAVSRLPPDRIQVHDAPAHPTECIDTPSPAMFQASQLELAQRIVDTVRASYTKDEWVEFDAVDFRVFVPPFKQLEEQTTQRAQACTLLPKEAADDDALTSRILPYSITNARKKQMAALKQAVKLTPKTLFLLIADECEWGAGKSTVKKQSAASSASGEVELANNAANDFLVNQPEWSGDDCAKNVVVLLVSATPAALLTSWSRVPLLHESEVVFTGYRVLENVPAAPLGHVRDLLPGTILSTADPADQQLIKKIHSSPGLAGKLQGLPHVIEWFEKQRVFNGMKIIIRTYIRQLTLTTQDRFYRVAHVPVPLDVNCPSAITVCRDTTYVEDQFVLHVDSAADSPNSTFVRLELPGTGAFPSLWLGIGADTTGDGHRSVTLLPERPMSVVKMVTHNDGSFVEFLHVEHAREWHLATIEDKVTGRPSAAFVDRSAAGGVFTFDEAKKLRTKKAIDKATENRLKFGPTADFLEVRAGKAPFAHHEYEFGFFFGDLYHGYRSLDSFIASMKPEVGPMPDTRLVRADPLWTPQKANSLLATWLRGQQSRKSARAPNSLTVTDCCPNPKASLCPHWKDAPERARRNFKTCITDDHLLLAEYVFFVLHYASVKQATPLQSQSAHLQELIESYASHMVGSLSFCPLKFVADYYSKEDRPSQLLLEHPTNETQKVVRLLLEPLWAATRGSALVGHVRGKMVVLRVSTNLQGYCFQHGLLLALTVSGLPDFCVIPDFGTSTLKQLDPRYLHWLQLGAHTCTECACAEPQVASPSHSSECPTCEHVHRPVSVYEDLLHLPCIVLLNEKGRMGDTFPHSFACMDLRLRHQQPETAKSIGINARTITQELGRMCRYIRPCWNEKAKRLECNKCGSDLDHDCVYALIGNGLARRLVGKYTMERADLPPSVFMRELKSPVNGAEFAPYSGTHMPTEKSYDFCTNRVLAGGPPPKHAKRFVLQAECQLGKTGTYMALIYQLKLQFFENQSSAPVQVALRGEIPLAASELHPAGDRLLASSFPSYQQLGLGKYHPRILQQRLQQLLKPTDAASRGREFLEWVTSQFGELAVCQAALQALERLVKGGVIGEISLEDFGRDLLDERSTIRRLLDWDGRMHARTRDGHSYLPSGAAGNAAEFPAKKFLLACASTASVPSSLTSLWQPKQAALAPSVFVPQGSGAARQSQALVAKRSSAANQPQSAVKLAWRWKGGLEETKPMLECVMDRATHVSAPSLDVAAKYFDLDGLRILGAKATVEATAASPTPLQRWIFNCTYARQGSSLLDYTDVMSGCAYRQVLVCRAAEFDATVAEWGGTHVIVAMASELRYPVKDLAAAVRWNSVTADKGGIGFARFFVQLLARQWGLGAVWLLDDNILRFKHAVVNRLQCALRVETVPFSVVMKTMEVVLDDGAVRERIGPASQYALIGTHRDERIYHIQPQLNSLLEAPHARVHCYSACLVNIDACFTWHQADAGGGGGTLIKPRQVPILFPPRLVWEDVEFNFLASEAKLLVVKYRHFCHVKKNLTPPCLLPPPAPLPPLRLVEYKSECELQFLDTNDAREFPDSDLADHVQSLAGQAPLTRVSSGQLEADKDYKITRGPGWICKGIIPSSHLDVRTAGALAAVAAGMSHLGSFSDVIKMPFVAVSMAAGTLHGLLNEAGASDTHTVGFTFEQWEVTTPPFTIRVYGSVPVTEATTTRLPKNATVVLVITKVDGAVHSPTPSTTSPPFVRTSSSRGSGVAANQLSSDDLMAVDTAAPAVALVTPQKRKLAIDSSTPAYAIQSPSSSSRPSPPSQVGIPAAGASSPAASSPPAVKRPRVELDVEAFQKQLDRMEGAMEAIGVWVSINPPQSSTEASMNRRQREITLIATQMNATTAEVDGILNNLARPSVSGKTGHFRSLAEHWRNKREAYQRKKLKHP